MPHIFCLPFAALIGFMTAWFWHRVGKTDSSQDEVDFIRRSLISRESEINALSARLQTNDLHVNELRAELSGRTQEYELMSKRSVTLENELLRLRTRIVEQEEQLAALKPAAPKAELPQKPKIQTSKPKRRAKNDLKQIRKCSPQARKKVRPTPAEEADLRVQ